MAGAGGVSGEDRFIGACFVAKSAPSWTTGYQPVKSVGIDAVFARCVVVILSDT